MKSKSAHLEDLHEIRNLMERSSRFISLSGLSGIFAGTIALAGVLVAWLYLHGHGILAGWKIAESKRSGVYLFLFTDAALVMSLAIAAGIFFTIRQARKNGHKIWDHTSKRLLSNLLVPLVAGGLFCIALLWYGIAVLVPPATLIFYGLSLLNAGKYTLDDVRYLGFSEIILGLVATIFVGYGLLFWSIGFGVLHIIYGALMYYKYER